MEPLLAQIVEQSRLLRAAIVEGDRAAILAASNRCAELLDEWIRREQEEKPDPAERERLAALAAELLAVQAENRLLLRRAHQRVLMRLRLLTGASGNDGLVDRRV